MKSMIRPSYLQELAKFALYRNIDINISEGLS